MNRANTTWTPVRIEELRQLMPLKLEYKQMAARMGLSIGNIASGVSRYIHHASDRRPEQLLAKVDGVLMVPRLPGRWSGADLSAMAALRSDGETYRAIGTRYGVTAATARKAMARGAARAEVVKRRKRAPAAKVAATIFRYTESAMTESWAEFSARKKAERAARAQAAQPMEMAA